MPTIRSVHGLEVLDSRGNPTVEVEVHLDDGSVGRAIVPSGASRGEHEAVELRDGDPSRYQGRGVRTAIGHVNDTLARVAVGRDAFDQAGLDRGLSEADGTHNKARLGANAILGVSLAVAHAAARADQKPLYRYLSDDRREFSLPAPQMNILNGGQHADNNVDIQEFMIYPIGASSFNEALQMGVETYHCLKAVLRKKGLSTAVGDEGGFAPNLRSNEEAVELILEAATRTGYSLGRQLFLALDPASSSFYDRSARRYILASENRSLTSEELIGYYAELVDRYPIASIEDGLEQNDWDGWIHLRAELGEAVQIVGDDITVTNQERLSRAIEEQAINAILIKPNQAGTLTETMETLALARQAGLGIVISHRSGETEDVTIADLAVATGAGQIKTGAPSRSERIAKYNRLLRIEEELGEWGRFPGLAALPMKRLRIRE